MRRTIAVTVLLAGVVCASAVVSAQGSPRAAAARVAKVELAKSSLGKILVTSAGRTLYRFTKDSGAKNTCMTVTSCPQTWPALTTSAHPTAAPGVRASLLSTIKLPSGAKQVTYAGHPLYLFADGTERAETVYVGVSEFGGTWDAVNAAGKLVR